MTKLTAFMVSIISVSIMAVSPVIYGSDIEAKGLSYMEEDSSGQFLYTAEVTDPNILVNGTEYVSTIDEAVALLDANYPNTIQLVDSVRGDLTIPSGYGGET